MKLKEDFIAMLGRLEKLPGGNAVSGLAETLAATPPSVAIRLNPRKSSAKPDLRRVPWAENGFYIDGERPRFTVDPAFHQGRYYVQDASSMFIGHIVGRLAAGRGPLIYIDACAAPGGKTTAAIDAIAPGSLAIANEFDSRRAEVLVENIVKWGYPDCIVSRGDTARFRRVGQIADIITVDAPCSGEGMMRKEEAAVSQWSPELIAECAALQREILANLWCALRPGGYMIYSTCTFNRTENEENLRYLVEQLGAEPVELEIPDDWGIARAIDSPYPAYRFIPGRIEGEGLFAAIVRRPAADSEPRRDSIEAVRATLKNHLDIIYSFDPEPKPAPNAKGKTPAPPHSLAMSTAFPPDMFPTIDVDYHTAVAYLRGEAVRPDGLSDLPRGTILLTYQQIPLGFAKNIGNRANNLYPDPYRIRTTHIPTTPLTVLNYE